MNTAAEKRDNDLRQMKVALICDVDERTASLKEVSLRSEQKWCDLLSKAIDTKLKSVTKDMRSMQSALNETKDLRDAESRINNIVNYSVPENKIQNKEDWAKHERVVCYKL